MLAILLLLSTSGDPYQPRTCDRAEHNQIYQHCDGEWEPRLCQWIFWDWPDRKPAFPK